ncbi:hypothetical protein BDV12DRAFT_54169 [Aspergillus spectabilis]
MPEWNKNRLVMYHNRGLTVRTSKLRVPYSGVHPRSTKHRSNNETPSMIRSIHEFSRPGSAAHPLIQRWAEPKQDHSES